MAGGVAEGMVLSSNLLWPWDTDVAKSSPSWNDREEQPERAGNPFDHMLIRCPDLIKTRLKDKFSKGSTTSLEDWDSSSL